MQQRSIIDGKSIIDGRSIIDGSVLEGGGQIIRIAAALAAIFNKSIVVENIRAKRPNPGLQKQHATGLGLVQHLCSSATSLTGAVVGSTEFHFEPGVLTGGTVEADIQSAGSVCLLIQIALPCAIFAPNPCILTLRGGTNTDYAPHSDYMTMVAQPIMARMGITFDVEVIRRGFYPKGGGTVVLRTTPLSPATALTPIIMEDPGTLRSMSGCIFYAGAEGKVLAEQLQAAVHHYYMHEVKAEEKVEISLVIEANAELTHPQKKNTVCGLLLVAETSTGCLFGSSEMVLSAAATSAKAVVDRLLIDVGTGGCVDQYLQDQLIIFMALAKGHSRIRIGTLELHTETAIYVTQLLTAAKFTVTPPTATDKCYLITCDGIGHTF